MENKAIDMIMALFIRQNEYNKERCETWEELRCKIKSILDEYTKTLQPSKPESECKCKWWRHCEVCRKADSVWAGIEKLNEVSPEVRDNINPDIVNLWDKLNEVIDRINKQ